MKDVQSILKQREELYQKQTLAAFDQIIGTLEGIEEYLISIDPSYAPGIFTWSELNANTEIVMLLGYVNYEPNQSFLMGGELVEVTEDNQEYFQRVLRIDIPLEVANQSDKDVTVEYLVGLSEKDISEEPLAEQGTVVEASNVPVKLKTDEEFEFDLDELSDEQRAALELSDKLGKLN